jgi:hypothetical protein
MAVVNLLDIAKLNDSDKVVGLIEEVLTFAPEVEALPARTIRGTSYKIVTRSSYPGVGFRSANEGVPLTKSEYTDRLIQAYILDAQIRADKAVADAYEDGSEAWKAIEATGVMRQAMIELGSQIIYGTTVDSKGFPGLQEMVAALGSPVIDAGGTTASTGSSVYGINTGVQGVQLIFGSDSTFTLGEWSEQQVDDSVTAANKFTAYVAGLTAWVGMQVGNKYSVGRLKDATTETNFTVTDAKLAQLLAEYPVGYRPNLWLMNRRSAYQLQSARSATSITNSSVKAATGADVFAPVPTESNGIPIVITDSITSIEALS